MCLCCSLFVTIKSLIFSVPFPRSLFRLLFPLLIFITLVFLLPVYRYLTSSTDSTLYLKIFPSIFNRSFIPSYSADCHHSFPSRLLLACFTETLFLYAVYYRFDHLKLVYDIHLFQKVTP